MLNEIKTVNQMNFAIWHSKNKCYMVLLELHKQHLTLSFQKKITDCP